MKAGIIGVPEGEADRITDVEAFSTTTEEYGLELNTVVETEEVQTLSGDTKFIEGTALKETAEDEEKAYIEDGKIRFRDAKVERQQFGEFTVVPANDDHNGFVIVSSSSATFAFDLIDRTTIINRAEISLGGFLKQHNDFSATTAGMSGHAGQVDSAVTWGRNVFDDTEFKDPLGDAVVADNLSQLAGQYMSDGVRVKANLSESGYVQVYEPDMDTMEFLDWVIRDILPFASGESDEDD